MADFATVAELEAFMGTTGLGARGTAMLVYASAEIRGFTRQDIDAVAGRQEEFAEGGYILNLTQAPVTAVSSITENLVAFTDFVWDRWGQIHRDDWSAWETGPIVVTYDSGYASTDDEFITVKSICLEVAARALGGNQAGSFETFGSEVPELRGAAPGIFLTESEQRQLARYALVPVG